MLVPVLFFFAFLRYQTASLLGAFDGWRGFSRPGLVAGLRGVCILRGLVRLSGSAAVAGSCGLPLRPLLLRNISRRQISVHSVMYGPGWFVLLAPRRWEKITAAQLEEAFALIRTGRS